MAGPDENNGATPNPVTPIPTPKMSKPRETREERRARENEERERRDDDRPEPNSPGNECGPSCGESEPEPPGRGDDGYGGGVPSDENYSSRAAQNALAAMQPALREVYKSANARDDVECASERKARDSASEKYLNVVNIPYITATPNMTATEVTILKGYENLPQQVKEQIIGLSNSADKDLQLCRETIRDEELVKHGLNPEAVKQLEKSANANSRS